MVNLLNLRVSLNSELKNFTENIRLEDKHSHLCSDYLFYKENTFITKGRVNQSKASILFTSRSSFAILYLLRAPKLILSEKKGNIRKK